MEVDEASQDTCVREIRLAMFGERIGAMRQFHVEMLDERGRVVLKMRGLDFTPVMFTGVWFT